MRPFGPAAVVTLVAGTLAATAVTGARRAGSGEGSEAVAERTCASPPPLQGRVVLANQESGDASVIELPSGVVTQVAVGGETHGAAISADGRWGVVADYGRRASGGPPAGDFDGNRLAVVDLSSRERRVVRTIETGEHRGLHDVAFFPGSSSRIAVTAQRAREVVIVDIARGAVEAAITTDADGSHTLTISPDGRTIVTSNEESGDISVIDVEARRLVRKQPMPSHPYGVTFSTDGRELWVGLRGSVRVLEAASGREIGSVMGPDFPDDLTMSPDGRLLLSAGGQQRIFVVDAKARRLNGTIELRGNAGAIADDSRVAFVAMGRADQVAAVDLVGLCEIKRFRVGRTPDKMGWARVR